VLSGIDTKIYKIEQVRGRVRQKILDFVKTNYSVDGEAINNGF